MVHPTSAERSKETGKLSANQTDRGSGELLDPAELPAGAMARGIAEVEVVETQLFVESTIGVWPPGKDPEDDLVVVPHEVAAHHVPAGVEPVELGGE
jgi:hypothetical protein